MKKRICVILVVAMMAMSLGCARNPYTGQYEADMDKIATMAGTAAITFGVGAGLYAISRANND